MPGASTGRVSRWAEYDRRVGVWASGELIYEKSGCRSLLTPPNSHGSNPIGSEIPQPKIEGNPSRCAMKRYENRVSYTESHRCPLDQTRPSARPT